MFQEQTSVFKINLSYGFVLKNKITGRFTYSHSTSNCCGRCVDNPFLSQTANTLMHSSNASKNPTSCSGPSINVQIRSGSAVGCVGIALPSYINKNKCWSRNLTIPRSTRTTCVSSDVWLYIVAGCNRYHLEPTVKALYDRYTQDDKDDVAVENVTGVTMRDLYRVGKTFETNVCVYKLVESEEAGKRRPPSSFDVPCVTTPTHCT